jgi:hypothetical protein
VRKARAGDPSAVAHVQRLNARQVHKVRVPEARPPLHACLARARKARAPTREGARDARPQVAPARGGHGLAEFDAHQAKCARLPHREEAEDAPPNSVLAVERGQQRGKGARLVAGERKRGARVADGIIATAIIAAATTTTTTATATTTAIRAHTRHARGHTLRGDVLTLVPPLERAPDHGKPYHRPRARRAWVTECIAFQCAAFTSSFG